MGRVKRNELAVRSKSFLLPTFPGPSSFEEFGGPCPEACWLKQSYLRFLLTAQPRSPAGDLPAGRRCPAGSDGGAVFAAGLLSDSGGGPSSGTRGWHPPGFVETNGKRTRSLDVLDLS